MTDFNFPTHEQMTNECARQKASGDAVRMLSDDWDKPEPGNFYTVSRSFERGDGSWVECFWEVLSVNRTKAFVRIHQDHGKPIERFWEISGRAWYLANDAWALKTPTEEAKP